MLVAAFVVVLVLPPRSVGTDASLGPQLSYSLADRDAVTGGIGDPPQHAAGVFRSLNSYVP